MTSAVSCHVFSRLRTSRWSCSMQRLTVSSSEPTCCRNGRPGSTWRGWLRSYSSNSGPSPAVTRGRPRTHQLPTNATADFSTQTVAPHPITPNILCPTWTINTRGILGWPHHTTVHHDRPSQQQTRLWPSKQRQREEMRTFVFIHVDKSSEWFPLRMTRTAMFKAATRKLVCNQALTCTFQTHRRGSGSEEWKKNR